MTDVSDVVVVGGGFAAAMATVLSRAGLDGVEGDLTFFVFPQGSGRARLYLCHPLSTADRFTGPGGPSTFLDNYRLRSLRGSDAVAAATVAGPCATLRCDDTWTSAPFVDGGVLIGDAAGYTNPLISQGLSCALRDVRILGDLLLSERVWSAATLRPYGEERGSACAGSASWRLRSST